mgnify:CR=1 FL=1|tara:strand:- start:31 stop:432 length:402 start_codon:yes stop_codon:yes gene_type:complete
MYTFVEYSVLVASMMRLSFFLCAIVLASSCGDEGRSSPASIPNRAPVITDPAPLSVREGASNVVSLSGTDADGKSLSFSILSGDDQSLFYQMRNEAQQDVMDTLPCGTTATDYILTWIINRQISLNLRSKYRD